MINHFTPTKIKRMEDKAMKMSIEYLKECYKNNKNEASRCLKTNEIIMRVLNKRGQK